MQKRCLLKSAFTTVVINCQTFRCLSASKAIDNNSAAAPSLVSIEWLSDVLKLAKTAPTTSRIKVVHAVTSNDEFNGAHIPQAACFNTSICRDTNSPYPNMLPKPQDFQKYVNENVLATNEDHLIVYDSNKDAPSLFPGARVWFMFKVFGHNKVSLLNGGLYKWMQDGRPISKHEDTPLATRNATKKFTASFRPELMASFEEVLRNVEHRQCQLVDARSVARFKGQGQDPFGKSGHIPNSLNMPYNTFVDPETKLILDAELLKRKFKGAKVDLQKPVIFSCGTGMTACALYFAAYVCGKNDLKLYNGSWAEWASRVEDDLVAKE